MIIGPTSCEAHTASAGTSGKCHSEARLQPFSNDNEPANAQPRGCHTLQKTSARLQPSLTYAHRSSAAAAAA
eukprot:3654542-Pleurochrysis_carterae.AAC.6